MSRDLTRSKRNSSIVPIFKSDFYYDSDVGFISKGFTDQNVVDYLTSVLGDDFELYANEYTDSVKDVSRIFLDKIRTLIIDNNINIKSIFEESVDYVD